MDQPAASMGDRGEEEQQIAQVPPSTHRGSTRSLEINLVGGGRGEEEQQIAQVGSIENEATNEV